ncbi:pentatricopeptide repeat-containing protein At3g62890-like [Aristolochia californica]|uniref:pentatricopeptide repeat-containing protein At3g62890-like n=1 Tax=Aristolochia californica TaxID=171875 RepID=UPI0035D9B156
MNAQLSSSLRSSINGSSISKPTINFSILETLLQKCRYLEHFNQLHSQMIVSGFINDTYAASRLLRFSTTSHFVGLDYSRSILNQIGNPNGFIWNTMMRAYVGKNSPQETIFLYKFMLKENFAPDIYTFPIVVQACSLRFSDKEGEQIHSHALRMGFHSDVYVQNTLINMYAVCGRLSDARQIFDRSLLLDSVSWNSILAGYVQAGDVEEAITIYSRMPEQNIIASNSMIVLFGRSGRVDDACRVFNEMIHKDLVSWSAMISCYEQNQMFREALMIFTHMNDEGVDMDEVVMISVLSACSNLLVIKEGNVIHGLILRLGFESYVNLQNALIHMYASCTDLTAAQNIFQKSQILDEVSWNSMITGYLKCGLIGDAKILFDAMPKKDVVSWSAMISGYTQQDRFSETLALFHEMQLTETKPDEITLVSVISACTRLFALEQGKWVHAYIRKNRVKINVILGTTLVDMYMKCGCVENALEVFNGMEEKGVSSWNATIVGLAMNGFVEESLEMFSDLKKYGVKPNDVTFVGVLGACRHVGTVNEGCHHFNSMTQIYNIEPNVKHYGCMVDLLGRAGLLREAEELIGNMPMKPDVATWGALLGACKKFGDAEMGMRIGRKLIELEPQHDGFHVLLANIFASKGRWDDAMEIWGMMKQNRIKKTPGCSMIEVEGVVHEFLAGDRTHPQTQDIDNMLVEMARRLKMAGYEPRIDEVAFDIEEEEKETNLHRHSEKLAIAFGLISTSPPMPIRILKNLRICIDCHTAAKFISRIFGREIVVRDRCRFHHFKDGLCSCADYW